MTLGESNAQIFVPCRGLGYVSNHIPLRTRYIQRRKETLIVTCVGKAFNTYAISHFSLLSVSGLHPEDITCMTTDSYHVYTACKHTIYAWRRGTEIKHTYRGHLKPVHLLLAFGIHLISIDTSSAVKVWDIKNEVIDLELKFSNNVFQITSVCHPSTYINKILFGSRQGEMQLWNINKSKLIYNFKSFGSAITCLEQAPAIDVVAVGLHSGKIVLHNLKFDEIVMEFTQDWGIVTSISFRSDSHPIMATGSACGHIVFWDLDRRRVTSQLLKAHNGPVNGMYCLPNEPLLLTSSIDNSLKLWIFDMPDGGARLLRIREGHSEVPTCIRFYGDNGENILSASNDSTLRIFNTKTEQFNKSLGTASYNRQISKKRGKKVEDALKMPPIVQFSSCTTREKEWDNIASIHLGLPVVTLWSYDKIKMSSIKLLPDRLITKKNLDVEVSANALCITPCGNFAIIGYSTGHIDRFNVQSGLWRDNYGNPRAHESFVRGIVTDSLNQLVISGGSDTKIKFWKFKSKGSGPINTLGVEDQIKLFKTHHLSGLLAVGLENFVILIVDIESKKIIRKLPGHSGTLTDMTFTPSAHWLITASMDRSIRIWNIISGELIDQFATQTACVSLDISPTGESLATAHVDYLGIFLWTNRTLYNKITLRTIDVNTEAKLIDFDDYKQQIEEINEEKDFDESSFKSCDQIDENLVTLSGQAASRWQNLLNIDVIKKRNKPKNPPKVFKASFFLPSSFTFSQNFDNKESTESSSKLISLSFENVSEFGQALMKSDDKFTSVIEKLNNFGPSMIDFEIKSLALSGPSSIQIILRFMQFLEFLLHSNICFELAESYLSVLLKHHGSTIAGEEILRNYLPNVRDSHDVAWERLRKSFSYSLCVVQFLRSK